MMVAASAADVRALFSKSAAASSISAFSSVARSPTTPCRSELSTIFVPMWPGMTTETPTWGAWIRKSAISASVKPFTANLAAEYAVWGRSGPRLAQKPFTLEVLTR